MSLDFIKIGVGSNYLEHAVRQQEQLSHFTQSTLQEDILEDYLKQWVNRKYNGDDHFLNWVKNLFRTENFLAFFKYYRFPLASAGLVNDKIKDNLMRVFHAEDAYFNYIIRGKETGAPPELNTANFEEKIFNALLFRHNDIVVHDLSAINTPFREIISIKNVVALESKNSIIQKLCYTAVVNGEKGYLYMDKDRYVFYNNNHEEINNIPHDLGECPADYISREPFSTDNDIVRKSIFSYSRELLEEYVFLKTLQRMTEPNGAVPITTELKVKTNKRDGNDTDGPDSMPMSVMEIANQRPELGMTLVGHVNNAPLQAGTRIIIPLEKQEDGNYNMDVIKNFINFHYIPIEALTYLNNRIQEIEKKFVITILGDYSEANESAKNELQVNKSYENKQDKLRAFSMNLSWIRNRSDFKFLALKYGRNSVMVNCFYGSDFFIETQEELYNLFAKSPNSIERKNILIRLSQNRNKFNIHKAEQEKILYHLIPYVSDMDFDKAIKQNIVDDITFQYQTRFNYWISLFEATYGDIVVFWNDVLNNMKDDEKLFVINKLITNLIKTNYEQSKTTINNRATTGIPQ